MKSPQQIKQAIDSKDIADVVYAFLEPLINKVYYMGYSDACDIYQIAIDKKNLREAWNND